MWVLVAHVIDPETGKSFVDRNVYVTYPTLDGVLLKLRFWLNKDIPWSNSFHSSTQRKLGTG
jgi:hypothetical protein